MLSPISPLEVAPVPIRPGVDVFGAPGWLMPLVLFPVGNGASRTGGAAGDTPEPPEIAGDWAGAPAEAARDAANT